MGWVQEALRGTWFDVTKRTGYLTSGSLGFAAGIQDVLIPWNTIITDDLVVSRQDVLEANSVHQ
jgi:hypothetical protein